MSDHPLGSWLGPSDENEQGERARWESNPQPLGPGLSDVVPLMYKDTIWVQLGYGFAV